MRQQTIRQLYEKYRDVFYNSDEWRERGQTKEEKKYLICVVFNRLTDLCGRNNQGMKEQTIQELKCWTSPIKIISTLAQRIAIEIENATF